MYGWHIVQLADSERVFPAWLDPSIRWNGWACPWFSRSVAEFLLDSTCDEFGGEWRYDEEGDYFASWDDICAEERFYGQDVAVAGHMYPIGYGCWIWTIAD